MEALRWVLALIAGIAGYELVRWLVLRRLRGRLRAGAVRFVRRHRIQLESARFIDRVWIREALAQDPAVEEAIVQVARQSGESPALLRARADTYAEEISPYFSLAAYYRLGAGLARTAVNFCFELIMRPQQFEEQLALAPPGAVRVYVMNHRSNADSLVLSYGLLRRMCLSYAVGEWALIWPLDTLFRAFGSYFVRRGERDPLYHAVLERFVQLLAGHGGVTGFYIEGGLTRDGRLRPPKVGLLDYLIGLRREHADREIVFMPVGLNYDRVFEDRHLVAGPPARRPRALERLLSLGRILVGLPPLIAANLLRVATRSHRKFGYAAVNFGEPLRLLDWPGGAELHTLEPGPRREALVALATHLLEERIARAIPATPVPVLCAALGRCPSGELAALDQAVRGVLAELRAVGAPIALGRAFESIAERRGDGQEGVPFLDGEVLNAEESERVLMLASGLLLRRQLLTRQGDRLEPSPGAQPILKYYAASIAHHLERAQARDTSSPPSA